MIAVGDDEVAGAVQDTIDLATQLIRKSDRCQTLVPTGLQIRFAERIVRFCTIEGNQRKPDEHQTHVKH